MHISRLLGVAVCLLAICSPGVGLAQPAVDLRRPTILVLIDPVAEIRKHEDDREYVEALGDFGVYTNKMVNALRGQRGVRVRWSSADSVRFPGTQFKRVVRREVDGGWGYVFYRPGHEPIVYEGVAVDDDLVCTAIRLFEIKVHGYSCG